MIFSCKIGAMTGGRVFRPGAVIRFGMAVISLFFAFSSVSAEVQTDYPAIGKIVVQGEKVVTAEGETQALYYGSGIYVAEAGDMGLVLTNWHVVSGAHGLLEVRFPNFQSPGQVILADEVWDLAAIVVRKPPFLPVPISLEVPQIGDELWVAGYGHDSGLEEFQVSSGPVLRYSMLDYRWYPSEKGPLPGETLMIGTAVRFGDSGGPILNRSGEVAGILSGSDGDLTIGTFCLRVQAFLTQAQFQLAHLPPDSASFFGQAEGGNIPTKKISVAAVPAQQALASSGVFPISSVPVYTAPRPRSALRRLPAYYKPATKTDIQAEAGNGDLKDAETGLNHDFIEKRKLYLAAHRNGYTLPPYPPTESPTLLVQRKTIGRRNPEVFPDGMDRPLRSRADSTVSMAMTGADPLAAAGADETTGTAGTTGADDFAQVSLSAEPGDTFSGKASGEASGETNSETTDETQSPEAAADGSVKKKLKEIIPGLPDIPLSDVQTIIVIIVILFLFINSLRLLSIAAERQKKEKK